MAEKKIIGRDALGNPIYEGGKLPGATNTARIGLDQSGRGANTNAARIGASDVDNTRRQTSPGRPAGGYSGGRDINYKNLQGAPPEAVKRILGITDESAVMPTQDELNKLKEDPTNPKGRGKGGSQYSNMLKALQQLSAMSQEGINSSMDSLTRTLQAQTNPFANFQAQQTQTTPELAALLQSQGVQQDPLQQYAAAINAQNTGQATAFQNLADTLGGFNTANQQGMIADAGQQRSDLLNQLQGSVFGTGARLMGKQAPNRNAIVQMLLQAMGNRA